VWLKGESFAVGTNDIISKYDHISNQRAYRLRLTDSGSNLYVAISSNGTSAPEDFVAVNLSIGVWYHLAVVYTASSGVVEYFKNSISLGAKSGFPTSIFNSNFDFRIGNAQDGQYFDGLIDDVRVWNTARTAAQIGQNYKKELSGSESNLQGYWRFDSVGDFTDATSNNNDLTASGSPGFSDDIPFGGLLNNRKSVDESVTSNTLQDDDELTIDLDPANTTYFIEGLVLAVSASRTPDIKIAFTVPSDATMDIAYISSRGSTFNHGELLESSGTASITIPIDNSNVTIVMIRGTVKLGSTTGTLTLQWAQATSNANATTVKEGSFLSATKY